jgi:hypothetical protein
MSLQSLKHYLLWASAIHYAILCVWAGVFLYARTWLYQLHARWFALTPEVFNALHYGLIGIYKIAIFLFCLVPYLVLAIAS